MWFRRMLFTGSSDTKSISVEAGQMIYFSCFTTNLRMTNFEADLDDGRNNFLIPCDTAQKGLSPFMFISDETAVLYFRPDSDDVSVMTVMVVG